MQKDNIVLSLPAQIPQLTDEQLKQDYLNYLECTSSIIEVLQLLDDEGQVLGVVRLALDVDLMLGAELAGAVKIEFQLQAVDLISDLEIPNLLKIELLKKTKSEVAIPFLQKILSSEELYISAIVNQKLFEQGNKHKASDSKLLKEAIYDCECSCKAADALGEIGGELATALLIEALQDQRQLVQEAVIAALGKVTSNKLVVLALIETLKEPDNKIRRCVAQVLGEIAQESAVVSLIETLNDEDQWVRESAAAALGKISSRLAVEALIYALDDEERCVRESAAVALGKIGGELALEVLIHALCEEEYVVRLAVIEALVKNDRERAFVYLSWALQSEDTSVRQKAASALREVPGVSLSFWLQVFQDQDCEVRFEAISAIADIVLLSQELKQTADATFELSDSDRLLAEVALVTALNDENFKVRKTAILVLGKISGESVLPLLLEALQDKNPEVRRVAVNVLGAIGSNKAKQALLQKLEDEEPDVCSHAASALGEVGDDSVIPMLRQALQDQSPEIRQGAASGLGAIGGELSLQALIQALHDENSQVRETIVYALERIGGKVAEASLIEVLLQDEDCGVCDRAAYALGTIGGEEAIAALRQALSSTTGGCAFDPVVETIIEALGAIGSESAIEAILEPLPSNTCLDVFASQTLALVGSLQLVPRLWQLIFQAEYTYIIAAVTAIQQRYGCYNPELCQETTLSNQVYAWQRSRNIFR